jgi:hypothetical protein
MDYKCDWYAPVLPEPESMTDITSETLPITAGGVQGLGFAPLLANCVYAPYVIVRQFIDTHFHRRISFDRVHGPFNWQTFV